MKISNALRDSGIADGRFRSCCTEDPIIARRLLDELESFESLYRRISPTWGEREADEFVADRIATRSKEIANGIGSLLANDALQQLKERWAHTCTLVKEQRYKDFVSAKIHSIRAPNLPEISAYVCSSIKTDGEVLLESGIMYMHYQEGLIGFKPKHMQYAFEDPCDASDDLGVLAGLNNALTQLWKRVAWRTFKELR